MVSGVSPLQIPISKAANPAEISESDDALKNNLLSIRRE